MDRILEIADRHRLTVIEDAAHAVGTRYRGIHAGGFGRIAIFSFHPLKNITTGEGGMITHNDDRLEKKLRLLRFHGIERDAWKRYGKGGNPEYDIEAPGYKYNLTDIQAALGIAQLARLAEFNRRRAELVATVPGRTRRDTEGLELPGDPPYPHDHAHHLFVVKILAMERERFMERLSEYNIGYGLHFPACHLLKYVKNRFGIVTAAGDGTRRGKNPVASPVSGHDGRGCRLCLCGGAGDTGRRRGEAEIDRKNGCRGF